MQRERKSVPLILSSPRAQAAGGAINRAPKHGQLFPGFPRPPHKLGTLGTACLRVGKPLAAECGGQYPSLTSAGVEGVRQA